MIELTEQQQRVMDGEQKPVHVIDPRTNEDYVLLRADQYNKLKDLIQPGPLTAEERETVMKGVWRRANWDDPRMDDYDRS